MRFLFRWRFIPVQDLLIIGGQSSILMGGKMTARLTIYRSDHRISKVTNLKRALLFCNCYERTTWIGRNLLSRNEIRLTSTKLRHEVIIIKQAFCEVDSRMDSPSKNVFDHVKFRSDLPVQYLCDVW